MKNKLLNIIPSIIVPASALPLAPVTTSSSLNSTCATNPMMTSVRTPQTQNKTIPMVILAATKSRNTNNTTSNQSSSTNSNSNSTESVKPSALKKPKTTYTRQCSAPSSSSSVIVPTSSSNASSRRNSGENRKTREKSPCVSFDADIVFVEPPTPSNPEQRNPMRARSRSDASSRFKGKIAWLRDRRDQQKTTICENGDQVHVQDYSANNQPFKAHRPRTRSDSKWIKIMRKRSVNNAEKDDRPFEWPRFLRQKNSSGSSGSGSGATAAKKETETEEGGVQRSASVAGLTNHEVDKVSSNLKRRSSERTSKKSVAFESSSWWSSSMKLLFDKGKTSRNKPRRRHLSSDARNFIYLHSLYFFP